MSDIAFLKRRIDLARIVEQTHELDRAGKVHCPFHDDSHPSCHIYRDGFKCFACGVSGDHLDWLIHVQGLAIGEAIERLELLARIGPRPRRGTSKRRRLRDRGFSPLDDKTVRSFRRRLECTRRLPAALKGRGLKLDDALDLGIAAIGDDALFAIPGPDGELLALKRRFHRRESPRYVYATGGHGSPAWCSTGLRHSPVVLVIEGELNGMVAALALREAGLHIGVMATAGTHGPLHSDVLRHRQVFLYADPDPAGRHALERWRVAALRVGAERVTRLPGFDKDACELAGRLGRPALARQLIQSMFMSAIKPTTEVTLGATARPDVESDHLSELPR